MPRDQAILLARDPQNHHFTVPEHAAWADVARTASGRLGPALNDAMIAIERANAHRQNNFDGNRGCDNESTRAHRRLWRGQRC